MEKNIDFKAISKQMREDLTRIRMLRTVFRILTCLVYLGALVWFGFCLFGSFFVDLTDYQISIETSKYVMIGFTVFFILHFAFMKFFQALNNQEIHLMSNLISRLFPGSKYTPTGSIPHKTLVSSRLFCTQSTTASSLNTTCYGRLDIPVGDQWMSIVDAGVSSNKQKFAYLNFLKMKMLYQYLVRPIFGVRIESTMHSFRGMFGCCKVQREFKGYVMLLPDHLENKIGYLAQTIQGFKQKFGAKFVHMEDPEFEKLFVVYADDEVEARMVLTPAMMRRMTHLRQTFNRDLMISFNEDTLYFASDTPDGFLQPGRKSLNNEKLLEQLYREIDFCRTVRKEIK